MKTETFGTGDQSWLGSFRGLPTARTEVVDLSTFTAGTHYVAADGYIRSGYPVAKVGGFLVPYNASGTGGTNVLAGHIVTDRPVAPLRGGTKIDAALMDFGRVKVAKIQALPGQSTFAAPAAANTTTTIVYI